MMTGSKTNSIHRCFTIRPAMYLASSEISVWGSDGLSSLVMSAAVRIVAGTLRLFDCRSHRYYGQNRTFPACLVQVGMLQDVSLSDTAVSHFGHNRIVFLSFLLFACLF